MHAEVWRFRKSDATLDTQSGLCYFCTNKLDNRFSSRPAKSRRMAACLDKHQASWAGFCLVNTPTTTPFLGSPCTNCSHRSLRCAGSRPPSTSCPPSKPSWLTAAISSSPISARPVSRSSYAVSRPIGWNNAAKFTISAQRRARFSCRPHPGLPPGRTQRPSERPGQPSHPGPIALSAADRPPITAHQSLVSHRETDWGSSACRSRNTVPFCLLAACHWLRLR